MTLHNIFFRPNKMNLARHYKHIILMLFALCLLLVSCRGVGGAGLSKSAVFASAYRSLRIGQVQTANNRVAITLAIDSREVLVIMSPDPSSPSLSDVLYRTPEGTIVQIRIDTRGLPRTAVSDSGSISFTNYTPFTFDFEIMRFKNY